MMLYAQDHFGFSERRAARRNRQAPRPEYHPGDRNARLLLDAAPQARRPLSHPGLHQYFLHAARRQRTSTSTCKSAWASATRKFRESGTFSLEEVECMGACTGAPCMQVNYDFYENLDRRQSRRASRAACRTARGPRPVPVTSGAAARTPARRSAGDQQALRHAQFAQDRRLPANTRAIRRSKKP